MSDLGQPALLLALTLALFGLAAGIYAGVKRSPEWTRVSERSVLLVFGLLTLAMAALFYAFATHDYALRYVASHSARSMPLHYRLAALWGGQDGSLLLWGWMLAAYGAAAIAVSRRAARTMLLLDRQSAIDGVVQRSRARGIVRGTGGRFPPTTSSLISHGL